MEESLSADSGRALSLGRSRSRGRNNPSELLARRQQLLSAGSESDSSPGWLRTAQPEDATNLADQPDQGNQQQQHRRSQVRRAKQLESPLNHRAVSMSSSGAKVEEQSSVEAKLESLSELLKSHQNETSSMSAAAMTALLDRNNGNTSNEASTTTTAKSIDNVYILLAKKEKDLQLAAELGKVLLEKNDELSKANERITEDYSHKLEVS